MVVKIIWGDVLERLINKCPSLIFIFCFYSRHFYSA